MSVVSQHEEFIERNGGMGVFRWIMEQDGVEGFETAKIYPVIGWNEYHHDDVMVIASAYRYKDYFVIINYEEDFSYFPERIRVWLEEVMDITDFDNLVEVFRDNHMISIYDENMEMMVEWYGEDVGVESLLHFASYQNNILLDDEIDFADNIIEEYEIHFNKNINWSATLDKLMREFLQNKTYPNPDKREIFYEKFYFNPNFNNFNPNFKDYHERIGDSQIWEKKDRNKINNDSQDFDDDFKEKWA